MKNIRFILLIAMGLMGCKTQQVVIIEEEHIEDLEPGKCFYSKLKDEGIKKEGSFIMEVVPPKYEETKIEFTNEQLKKYDGGTGKYTIPLMKHHVKLYIKEQVYIKNNQDLTDLPLVVDPNAYVLCLVEVPSNLQTISKQELLLNNNTVIGKKLIQKSKIIKKYVKKKPKRLKQNQYYFKAGYWTELKEAHAGIGFFDIDLLYLNIKRKLINLGYDLEENNLLTEKTKEALRDFQKKKGIKVGLLDGVTLFMLGITTY